MNHKIELELTEIKSLVQRIFNEADMSLLEDVIRLLSTGAALPEQYRDHALVSSYSDFRKSHIKPDWLLTGADNRSVPV